MKLYLKIFYLSGLELIANFMYLERYELITNVQLEKQRILPPRLAKIGLSSSSNHVSVTEHFDEELSNQEWHVQFRMKCLS